mmetsp:Transcript_13782/g.29010  ORF Transcript_13782/g.29010 Transcript_13782/m.29010 type:complete len:211 (+) Transcript_13782:81-713(+)
MKSTTAILAATVATAVAFQQPTTLSQSTAASRASTALFEYIPTGFTKESWAKFKEAEAKKKAAQKNLGRMGPKGFQSRSFQSFQEALERGEASHMMPVENAKERLRKGEIKLEDIPYMQRGGSWDNSDIKGAKKVRWLESDKEYADGGFKKEQSVSIFGFGQGLDWTGTRGVEGPSVGAPTMKKNYKAPTVSQLKGQSTENPKKKLFGFF